MKKFCLFLILSVALTPVYTKATEDERTKSAVVTGEAIILNGNIPQAKQQALHEAFNTAITKMLGSFITAESYTRNYESIERSILGRTQGYIKTYKIIRESIVGNIFTMKVNVSVSEKNIKNDLLALGIVLDAVGNPSVMVTGHDEGLVNSVSSDVLKNQLISKGFSVNRNLDEQSTELAIKLKGVIHNVSLYELTGFYGCIVETSLRAYWISSNNLIVSINKRANGAGTSRQAALVDAYHKAANALADEFVDKIVASWQNSLNNGQLIEIQLNCTDYKRARMFIKRLSIIFGVKSVQLQHYKNGGAVLLTRFSGKSSLLAALIKKSTFHGFTPHVIAIERKKIALDLGK